MDEWLESHVKNNEYTDIDIKAYLIFGFDQEEFRVPPGGLKCDMSIQTSILVDGQQTNFEQKGCNSIKEEYSTSDSQTNSDKQDSITGNTTDLENSTQTNSSSDELLYSDVLG